MAEHALAKAGAAPWQGLRGAPRFALAALLVGACAGAADPAPPAPSADEAAAPAAGLVGRVLTPEGVPVAGALIVPRPLDEPPPPVPEIAILTAADGRFAWPLPPGRYRLAALHGGREIAAATATSTAGRATPVELVVGR